MTTGTGPAADPYADLPWGPPGPGPGPGPVLGPLTEAEAEDEAALLRDLYYAPEPEAG